MTREELDDRERWRLRRDQIITGAAIALLFGILIAAIVGDIREDAATFTALIVGAFGLLGAPFIIRQDERRRDQNGD